MIDIQQYVATNDVHYNVILYILYFNRQKLTQLPGFFYLRYAPMTCAINNRI